MKLTKSIRHNLYAIELIELLALSLIFDLPMLLTESARQDTNDLPAVVIFVMVAFAAVGLWGTYLLYIRIARAGGPIVDIGLWVALSALTASFTFWCWTILDLNRWVMVGIFYTGKTPVEYAWSIPSKHRRKEYELAKKSAQQTPVQRAQLAKEHPLPVEVEQDLADLSSLSVYTRKDAAKKLSDLTVSHERVVTALLNAKETDNHIDVRGAAAAALLVPVHQAMLQEPTFAPTLSTVQTQLEVKKAKMQTVASQQAANNKMAIVGQAIGWVLIGQGGARSLLDSSANTGFYWGLALFGILLVVVSRR